MTVRNLDKMFFPRSAAVFGASNQAASVGKTVTDNILSAGFSGPVWLVNPRHAEIAGHICYPDAESLPEPPDLAIIATPPETVPGLIDQLGKKGTRAVVVITAGVEQQDMLNAAQPYCLRIIGPNCFGLMLPPAGLNGSFAHLNPHKGDLAFMSQSGAIISAVIDWAGDQNIGFSHVISLGNMADVDVGDVLDYLAMDIKSRAILIYLEHVTDARKFMSAARAAARIKPVIVIKSGRRAEGAKAAASHTGAMAGEDIIYDAAEVLSRIPPATGNRLAIVTNGGGAGVMAVDRLIDFGGTLAALSPRTLAYLDKNLPAAWSRGNPVDIIGDAGPERYETALRAVLDDPNADAVLVINCPTALASGEEAARKVIESLEHRKDKPVLASWLGGKTTRKSREILAQNNIPAYSTPEDAVRGFSYLTGYTRLQEELMQTPPSLPQDIEADSVKAHAIIRSSLQEGRSMLTELEAKDIFAAYGIPIVPTRQAATPGDVQDIAEHFLKDSKNIVVKILSKKITHKSDVGGVALNLASADLARKAAQDMLDRLGADIDGFSVQPMINRPGAHELILGVADDRVFGPVILFGAGGTGAEIINDKAVALPPLDLRLARDLMERTRIYRLLKGYRNRPTADLESIAVALVRLSHMVSDCPEIRELDVNPLLADEKGVLALDARIAVKDTAQIRMAIRPYPRQWVKEETLPDGMPVLIRPIRPEDEKYYEAFMDKLNPDDIRQRLFEPMRHVSHSFAARLTQIDYARAMAFIALGTEASDMLGVSRISVDPDYKRAEFAVITRSDLKGRGIGWALMKRLIDYAQAENIQELWGQVLIDNAAMLEMCRKLGFIITPDAVDPMLAQASLNLEPI
jgi:acetyltransferase